MKSGPVSLSKKFTLVFMVVALLQLTGAATVLYRASAQRTDAAVINLAGAQRMLTQKMAKEYLLVRGGADDAALRKLIERFDRVMTGLRDGDAELGLPAAQDAEIKQRLAVAVTAWQALRQEWTSTAAGGGDSGQVAHTLAAAELLLQQMDAIVKLMEQQARQKVETVCLVEYGGDGGPVGTDFARMVARGCSAREEVAISGTPLGTGIRGTRGGLGGGFGGEPVAGAWFE